MPAKLKSPDSHFVQIDIEFAKEHGLNEAIMAGKMLRLQEYLTGATDDNGIKWIRLTLEEWQKELPFLGEMTIRRTIENLETNSIFLSTTFTGRSKWYRLNPDYLEDTQHNTTVQKEQIHYDNCAKRTDVSVQNEQLPISSPISSYSLSHGVVVKTNKQAELTLLEHKDLALKLIAVCGYDSPEFVVNGKKIECANSVLQLVEWQVTPEQLDKFPVYWWGNAPPVFRQVIEEWGKFLASLKNPDRFNKIGATNGHNKQNNGSGLTSSTDPDRIPTVNPFANSG